MAGKIAGSIHVGLPRALFLKGWSGAARIPADQVGNAPARKARARELRGPHPKPAFGVGPFEALFAVLFLLYLFAPVRGGDDVWFITTYLTNFHGDLAEFLAFRYETWSTRLLLEAFTLLLLKFPILYRISMPLWLVSIAAATDRLLGGGDKKRQWLLCASILLLPMAMNSRAGYVCTTVNYVFTLACFLWAVLPVVEYLRGGTPPLWRRLLSLPLTALACNMEYYGPMFLLLLLFLAAACVRGKKNPMLPLVLALIAFLSLVFAFTAPASTLASYGQDQALFPEYELLGAAQKLGVGLISTAGGLTSLYHWGDQFLLGTLVFGALLALRGWEQERGPWRALHAAPLAMTLLTGPLARLFSEGSLWRRLFLDGDSGWLWSSPWLLLLAGLFFAAVLACLWRTDRRLGGWAAAALFCRVTMGASRSVFASGLRTFYPLLLVLCVACAVLCVQTEKARRPAVAVLSLGAAGTVFLNFIHLVS